MGKNDFSDLGNQIKESVQKAVDSMDFQKLNEDITKTVNQTIEEVKKGIGEFQQRYMHAKTDSNDKEYSDSREYDKDREYDKAGEDNDTGEYSKDRKYSTAGEYSNRRQGKEKQLPRPVIGRARGSVKGVLFTVFGSIGTAASGVGTLSLFGGIAAQGMIASFLVGLTALVPIFGVFLFMMIRGIFLNGRTSRFRQYVRKIDKKTVCKIEDLARTVGKQENYVKKDLNRMIRIGMFPEGHIDEQQTCIILNNDMYQLYRESMLSYRQREEERRQDRQQETEMYHSDISSDGDISDDISEVIETGKEYIEQIRAANEALKEQEISEKLQRLENIITNIFKCVEQNPKKLSAIKRFTEYYLPTTLKLVKAYEKFEQEPIQGENIKKSKTEIKQTLDTINDAFEKLLDSLYEDIAMDISVDISVLQTMMAQEGLTGHSFKKADAEENKDER